MSQQAYTPAASHPKQATNTPALWLHVSTDRPALGLHVPTDRPALGLQDMDMAVQASPDRKRESALSKVKLVAEGLEEELFLAESLRHDAEVRLWLF